jgi:RimJ/RimL family protein N-acetyltransferase
MGALMLAADLAIGAGGLAIWERCCLGLPAFVIPTAQNQKKQVVNAANVGLIYAPQMEIGDAEEIVWHLQALLQNPALLRFLSKSAMAFVDGNGVLKDVNQLISNQIHIREALLEDSENLFSWRNMPYVREVSRDKAEIHWGTHQAWFASVLVSDTKYLLIGEVSGNPVGVVRFDVVDEVAEVSIYLVPGKTGRGLGNGLLTSAEDWFLKNVPGIRRLKAVALGRNDRSKNLFLSAGYDIEQTHFSKEINLK